MAEEVGFILIGSSSVTLTRHHGSWLIRISEINLADAGLYLRVGSVGRLPRREIRIGKHPSGIKYTFGVFVANTQLGVGKR
jgi:hypothetical protein